MRHNSNGLSCAFCGSQLLPATPLEHVIPQGIGGVLASRKITCGDCNRELNDLVDAHLVKHFKHLVLLLRIRGTKGKPYPMNVKLVGKEEGCRLNFGGITEDLQKVRVTRNADGTVAIEIHASTTKEMNFLMEQAKKSLKEITHTEIISTPKADEYAAGDMIEIPYTTGDETIHRGIARIAVNFYSHHCISHGSIAELCRYIRGEVPGYVVNPYFPEKPAWSPLPEKAIAHSLQIRSFPEKMLLIAIVELFNIYRYYVIIDRFYLGPEISETYSYDIIERKTIDRTPVLEFESREAFFQTGRPNAETPNRVFNEGTEFMNRVGYHMLKPHIGKFYPVNGKNSPERVMITTENIDSLAPSLHKSLGAPTVRLTR